MLYSQSHISCDGAPVGSSCCKTIRPQEKQTGSMMFLDRPVMGSSRAARGLACDSGMRFDSKQQGALSHSGLSVAGVECGDRNDRLAIEWAWPLIQYVALGHETACAANLLNN